jgi:predicted amidohydrolase
MTTQLRAACVQLNSAGDMPHNLDAAARLAREAAAQGAQFIMLPEYAALLHGSGRVMRENAHPEADHPALRTFQELARETGAWLLIGSLVVTTDEERLANRSLLLAADGTIVARYDKIHMFDATLPGGRVIRESGAYRPGTEAVVAQTPWGLLGMTVCYDLRFPQLYRALAKAGAQFLAVPSSFARETGAAHWLPLLQARAIESGCFVFAPAMCGEHTGNRAMYGHTLILDPWGRTLAELGDEPGVALADIDTDEVARVHAMLPTLEHDREFSVRRAGAAVEARAT